MSCYHTKPTLNLRMCPDLRRIRKHNFSAVSSNNHCWHRILNMTRDKSHEENTLTSNPAHLSRAKIYQRYHEITDGDQSVVIICQLTWVPADSHSWKCVDCGSVPGWSSKCSRDLGGPTNTLHGSIHITFCDWPNSWELSIEEFSIKGRVCL